METKIFPTGFPASTAFEWRGKYYAIKFTPARAGFLTYLCRRNRNSSGYLARQFREFLKLFDMVNKNLEGNPTDATKVANNLESANASEKTGSKPRRKNMSPVYSVLKRARAQFGKQVDQNTETKRKCIESNISKYYADPLRFWLDFKNETKALLNTIPFNEACRELGLVPENVAEHIVFEGKKLRNNIRDNSLDIIGEQVMKFNAPLFMDTEELYSKQTTAGSDNQQTEQQKQ